MLLSALLTPLTPSRYVHGGQDALQVAELDGLAGAAHEAGVAGAGAAAGGPTR